MRPARGLVLAMEAEVSGKGAGADVEVRTRVNEWGNLNAGEGMLPALGAVAGIVAACI